MCVSRGGGACAVKPYPGGGGGPGGRWPKNSCLINGSNARHYQHLSNRVSR